MTKWNLVAWDRKKDISGKNGKILIRSVVILYYAGINFLVLIIVLGFSKMLPFEEVE